MSTGFEDSKGCGYTFFSFSSLVLKKMYMIIVLIVHPFIEDMLQVITVSTSQPGRHLIAGGSGTTPAIYLWEKSITDEPEEDKDMDSPGERDRSERSNNGVNGSIILLMLILTYANWSPHFYRFLYFLSRFLEQHLRLGEVRSEIPES